MENSLAKIIVKVGKQSKVKISHCKAFRAIVAEDLERLTTKYSDCNIVIIENITEDENNTVKAFIEQFVNKDSNNSVFFFIADENDEITSGLADELDYNIYYTLADTCEAIKVKYGLDISASLEDRKQQSLGEVDIPEMVLSLDGNSRTQTEIESSISSELEQIEEESPDEFNNIAQSRQEELERSAGYEEKSLDDPNDLFELPTFDISETSNDTQHGTEAVQEEVSQEQSAPVSLGKDNNTTADNKAFEEYKERVQEEIEKLQTKLKDAKYDYNMLLKDIQGANTRIVQLEEMIGTLKSEKQAMQDRFDELMSDETVLEDPISLSEYSALQETIENKDNTISKLEQTIESLKEQLDESKSSLELKDVELDNLNGTITELKTTIESGEANKDKLEACQEEIERYKASAEALRSEKDKLSDKITNLGEMNQEIQSDNEELRRKISLEVDYRKECISLIQLAFTKVMEVNKSLEESAKSIQRLQQEVDRSNGIIKDLRNQNDILNEDSVKYQDTIKQKEESIEKMENAMRNSDSFLDEKLGELSATVKAKEELEQSLKDSNEKVSTLKAQLGVVEAQLKQKEDQYNILLTQKSEAVSEETSVASGTSDSQVVEANKQLSQTNKSLMEQLSVVTKELNARKQAQDSMQAEIAKYKEQLNNMPAAGGSEGTEVIPPIQYAGRAQLISVCSSGSFGATTLAMSILARISPTAKVLYLDLDMVSPNADAWFCRSPFCQGLPGINRDTKASALGIFYERGMKTFASYIDKIIPSIEKTKGGCVDYLSGVYYRVDRRKITRANYSEFFTLLGSKYEYIIIDLGRLGNSDINDMLIQAISEITYKNIVVTTPDKFEVRNFNLKIRDNKMNPQKIAWLLNMCVSGQLEPQVQKAVSAFKYGQIFEDPALRGTRDKFTRDRQNRDRLDTFINSALFSR